MSNSGISNDQIEAPKSGLLELLDAHVVITRAVAIAVRARVHYWGPVLLLGFYLSRINAGAGSDLALRISESSYFLRGINPYLVYVGARPIVPAFGQPFAYSMFSYFFAAPLTLIPLVWAKVVFAVFDLCAQAITICLIARRVDLPISAAWAAYLAVLLPSTFYIQHVTFLNYSCMALLGLSLLLEGVLTKARWLTLLGAFLVGLKPSLAVPALLLIAVARDYRGRDYRCLASIGLLYIAVLVVGCVVMGETPLQYLHQLMDTQQRNARPATQGIFAWTFLFDFKLPTVVSILLCLIALLYVQRDVREWRSAMVVAVASCLVLFFNQVHAYLMVVVPFLIWLGIFLKGRIGLRPGMMLAVVILVPKLEALVPDIWRIHYVAVVNGLRFGILLSAAGRLVRTLRCLTAEGTLSIHGTQDDAPAKS